MKKFEELYKIIPKETDEGTYSHDGVFDRDLNRVCYHRYQSELEIVKGFMYGMHTAEYYSCYNTYIYVV